MFIDQPDKVLSIYNKLYKTMLREGILSLEDFIDEAYVISGFAYPLIAFTDAYPGEACFKMYEGLEQPIRNTDHNYDWLRKLAEEFFVNSEQHWKYICWDVTGWQARLSETEKHVDEFVEKMRKEYDSSSVR